MTGTERALIGLAKVVAYAILIITAAVVLFRFGVGALWGSGSDLGLIAAPGLGALGVIGLAYLVVLANRDTRRHFNKKETTTP